MPRFRSCFGAVGRLLALAICAQAICAFALDPQKPLTRFGHRAWQTEDGLPQNSVHAIVQSNSGFLWMATEAGLVRFDGIDFAVFDTRNTPQLASNDVRGLTQTSDGALWIATSDGVTRLVGDGGAGSEWKTFTTSEGLSSNSVNAIAASGAEVFVATVAGLDRLPANRAQRAEHVFTSEEVRAVSASPQAVWFATADAIYRFGEARAAASASGVRALYAGERRTVFATNNGVFALSAQGQVTEIQGFARQRVNAVYEDREGALWIGTSRGAARSVGGTVTTVGVGQGLSGNLVSAIYEDGEGDVWIGTENSGVNVLRDQPFTALTAQDGLTDDSVTALAQARDGAIWAGTNGGGLDRIDAKTLRPSRATGKLGSDVVLALASDSQGITWVGTPDGLVRMASGATRLFTAADGLADDFVRSVFVAADGAIWIGTRHGLSLLRNGNFSTYTAADGLASDYVGAIAQTPDGTLWVATRAGLSRATFGSAKFETVAGLAAPVTALEPDPDGELWIGTEGAGLYVISRGMLSRVVAADVPATISGLVISPPNLLWIACKQGIAWVATEQLLKRAKNGAAALDLHWYGAADGMKTRETSSLGHPSAMRAQDGTLWFATMKGIAITDPAHLPRNTVAPPVAIESVAVDGEPVDASRPLVLAPGSHRIAVHYAGLSFVAPQAVRYKYKLDGFDRHWIDAEGRRDAFYTNVPAGTYSLRVMAANNDGVWSTREAALGLRIRQHFYRTVWFYLLCAACAVGFALLLYRLRLRRVRAQYDLVVAERTRIAREIHDTLAQDFIGLSVQLELVSRMLSVSAESAREHLDRARILVRNSVANARNSVWRLRSPALENAELPAVLSRWLLDATADSALHGEFALKGTYRALTNQTENNILRVAQEAVTNALRHSGARNVEVTLEYDVSTVSCQVRDDGHGFDAHASAGAGHYGLIGMRERAAQIGGTLSFESSGNGTTVILSIPIPAWENESGEHGVSA